MPKQLWLLRHGDAEDGAGMPDEERRLTSKGEDQSRAAGRALAALGVEFAHVFTSPRVRARQTAELACESLGMEPEVHEPLSMGFGEDEALDLASAVGEDERVLAVGHEPDFSQVVYDLTGGRADIKKGGVVGIELDGSSGTLIVLLRANELRRIH
jgi:phosphohistidine phosphatase